MTTRRGFLGAMLAAAAAPAIVRVSSLMPVAAPKIIMPPAPTIFPMEVGSWEGIRFIESDFIEAHQQAMADAVTTGTGVLTVAVVDRIVKRMKEGQRPHAHDWGIYVHPSWGGDLRAAGIPVRRRR